MSSGKALSEGEQKMHARVYDAQIKQLGRARSGLTGAVYLALCRRGRLNKDTGLRQCWPFLKQICEDAGGASERTVRRCTRPARRCRLDQGRASRRAAEKRSAVEPIYSS